jgi:hypothetical protein
LEGRCAPSTVTSLADAGPGSLRDALATTPLGGTVDFQPDLSGTITLTSATLAITQDVTIAGPGASVITVSGNNAFQVFNIAPAATVMMTGLTIANGNSPDGDGGGIYNSGTLAVTDCTVSNNSVRNSGGGIFNTGTLSIIQSTLSGNTAQLGAVISLGGAIYNDAQGVATITTSILSGNEAEAGGGIYNSGTLAVIDSTLSANSAVPGRHGVGGTGAGIYNDSTGRLLVIESTMTGNSALSGMVTAGMAGAIENGGTLTLIDSTVSGNSARGFGKVIGQGGGIMNEGTLSMQNTILAGNTATAGTGTFPSDLYGSLNDLGHNLIGGDPGLGPLQDNGGPTWTMALLPGSPAVGAGALTDMEWDQRGPGYPRLVNGATDIGAYEVQDSAANAPAARPGLFAEAVLLVPGTALNRPVVPAMDTSGAFPPTLAPSAAVNAVDRLFASSRKEAAGLSMARMGHPAASEVDTWALDLVPGANR